ncbi:alpha/beta hydrolase [Candidatus Acetothermia bacterium]|nr:alpha/beta hydrolase [Candidatus Acetothermia bacterium]MBI3461304.1 alpha/beta hydrolase [Candidatus Acetothermia bacterium]
MPRAKVDGSEVYCSMNGSGRSILFVHGSGCDHSLWEFQTQDLQKNFSVAAIDLNGHGLSAQREGDAMETYVDDVLAVIETLNEPVFLVGHSLGSAIVQTVALKKPKNLAGLGLIGAGAKLRVHPQILEMIDSDFPKAVELILNWSFLQPAKPELMQRAREQMLRNGQAVLGRDLRACDGFNMMDRLSEIAVPTLIVCGRHDQLTPVKYSEYLKSQLARSELQIIESVGHRVMEEKPTEFNRVLCNFAQSVS